MSEEITIVSEDIGYVKDGNIVKKYSDIVDGMVYKNTEAFLKKQGICYVNIFNAEFTYADILKECGGNEPIAIGCFEMLVECWNYPESYIEDGIESGWFGECSDCHYIFDLKESEKCPKCNSKKIE